MGSAHQLRADGIGDPLYGRVEADHLPYILTVIGPVFLFGGTALLVGSVLPDVDGRGRIRWIIGPITGCMLFMPALYGSLSSGGYSSALDYVQGRGSLIFLMGTGVSYSSLLVPKKHRGIFHTKRAALLFGALWGAFVMFTAGTPLAGTITIGLMASLGYLWHLSLDGEL